MRPALATRALQWTAEAYWGLPLHLRLIPPEIQSSPTKLRPIHNRWSASRIARIRTAQGQSHLSLSIQSGGWDGTRGRRYGWILLAIQWSATSPRISASSTPILRSHIVTRQTALRTTAL